MSLEIDGYTIQKALGSGGMSTVYLAIQNSLGRPCALKVLSSALVKGDSFTDRFEFEGRTIARLQHSNIVNIYDIATHADCCYIAMEYLPGGTLHERLHDDLSLSDVLSIIKQVARALGFAHEQNIVHRDIKPANIMFRRDGSVVLTDFGIAKHLAEETAALTGTGSLIGTPAYMSPEQIQVGELTGRSDLYSLGVVFYETLIGVQPYVASNPIAVAYMHVNTPIPTLPEPIGFLQDLLNKALAKSCDDRFQSAADLITAINKVEREHDTARIMLLHSRKETAAPLSDPAAQHSLLAQHPDTNLITVLDRSQQANATPDPPLPPPAKRSKFKWLALAAVLGMLAFGAVSYRSYLGEQHAEEYARLLEVAQRQIAQQRFVAPEGDNLYVTLSALEELAANDVRAAATVQAFTDRILLEARRAQAHGSFEPSLVLVDKGLQFAPANARLEDLRRQVDAQLRQRQKELRQQQQQQAIQRLLALAQAQIEAKQLTQPDGDNAVNSLRQVLALAPKQAQALASLDVIAARYAQRAAAVAAENAKLAADIIDQGLAISASNGALLQQQQALQERSAQRELTQKLKVKQARKIEGLLATAKTQLAKGKLVTPASSNAEASYQQVLQLHENNEDAKAGLLSVAVALAKNAQTNVAEQDLDSALANMQAALAIAPDNKDLLRQQQQIAAQQQQSARTARERQARIKQLLQLADTQIGRNQLSAPANDNAIHSLQQVLAVAPENRQALKRMQRVADAFETLARDQLAQGADQRSERYVIAGLRVVAEHNGLLAVQRELLERAREKTLRAGNEREARGQRVEKLLKVAAEQLAAQQFTAPDSDNAYANWRAVLTLEPNNRKATKALSQLPKKILQQAKAEFNRGEIELSQKVLQQGLQVWPDDEGMQTLDSRIAQVKTEQQRELYIAQLLRTAAQQRREGSVFSPPDSNAVASLQRVLKHDANNAAARTTLRRIVQDQLSSADESLQQEQFKQTERLLANVASVQPELAKLHTLQAQLAVRRRITSLFDTAEKLAAQRRFTLPAQNSAWLNYRRVLQLDPIHEGASDAIAQLRQTIFEAAKAALQAQDWQWGKSLIDQGLVLLPGDKRLLTMSATLLEQQTRVAQQRDQQEAGQRIERLISVAINQMSRRQLSAPAGDNAVATVEQILLLDPGNSEALQIKARIAESYVRLIRETMQAEDSERAQVYVARGLEVAPNNTTLTQYKKQLEQQQRQRATEPLAIAPANTEQLANTQDKEKERAAKEQQQRAQNEVAEERLDNPVADKQLAALLEQAEQQRKDKHMLTPADDNALASYRQALQLNAQSTAAHAGIESIKRYYLSLIKAQLALGAIPKAAAWTELVRRQLPADATFISLQQELLTRVFRDTLRDGDGGPALIYAPAGSFSMGDTVGTGPANEQPAHQETLPQGFMLGQMEVSFTEYDRYVRASGAPSPSDQGWGRDLQPVINISWREAQAYLAWLSAETGQQYRLPSEIEWEYAARAGTDSDYWWGTDMGSNNANCKGCGSEYGGKRGMPVGSFNANPFGLLDTAGNVHEWVSSPYGVNYPADGSTLSGPGNNAIARGGSWYDTAEFSRASARVVLSPDFKNFFVGFRVYRALPKVTETP